MADGGMADGGVTGGGGGRAADEWRSGWTVVLACAMGMALSTIHVYSTGVFIAPLEREFGWSRAEISSGLTIVAAFGVVSSPFVGLAIDRFGPRRIGLFGTVGICAAIALLATAGPSIWTWWAIWALAALVAAGIKPTIWTAAVASLFERGRGFALSVMLCGTGLGSSITPVLCNWLIDAYGWRIAYVGLAGFWFAAVFPVVFLCLSSARDRRRRGPDPAVVQPTLAGLTAREGLTSARFHKLATAAFLISLVAVSFTVNLVPILSFTGLTRTRAAELAGLVGLASVVGRLAAGMMLDRWNGNRIAAVSVAMPVVSALLLLAAPGDTRVALVAAVVLGLSLGSELDAVAYLATRHFGMRSFGVLFGTIAGLLALSVGVGPLAANLVYDLRGSYYPVLWAYVPLCLVASALFLSLGPYPDHAAEPA